MWFRYLAMHSLSTGGSRMRLLADIFMVIVGFLLGMSITIWTLTEVSKEKPPRFFGGIYATDTYITKEELCKGKK